jgi:hypothetical protein
VRSYGRISYAPITARADTQEVTPTGVSSDTRYFDGKVGIGTSDTSGYQLKLVGAYRMVTGGSESYPVFDETNGTYMYANSSANSWVELGGYDTQSGSVPLLLQRVGGNVGIGTTSPSTKLYVNGDGYFSSHLSVGTYALQVNASSNLVGIGTTPDYGSVLKVYGNISYGAAGLFQNDGNNNNRVGIGIAAGMDTPTNSGQENVFTLFHDGDGTQRGGIALFDGDPDIYTTSDPRIKTDIAPTQVRGVSVIDAIELIEYRRVNEDGEAVGVLVPIGFNAENVAAEFPSAAGHLPEQETFPSVAGNLPDQDIRTVAPGKFIPVLIKAVQELSAQNESLNQTVADLSAQVWDLKLLVCADHPEATTCNQ